MLFTKLLAALSVTTCLVDARAVPTERTTTSVGSLYGYGTNITGLRLFYGDGIAFLGQSVPDGVSVATNVTFTETSDGIMQATPTNSTLVANWTTPDLFIDQSAGAFVSAGFVSASNSSVTTTGFTMFGTLLTWEGTDGILESKWYAEPTGQLGLYYLKWNVDNVIDENATPIALKNLAPQLP